MKKKKKKKREERLLLVKWLSLSVFCLADSVDNLMAETHELGGSTVVVDRATPKASDSMTSPLLT